MRTTNRKLMHPLAALLEELMKPIRGCLGDAAAQPVVQAMESGLSESLARYRERQVDEVFVRAYVRELASEVARYGHDTCARRLATQLETLIQTRLAPPAIAA